MFLRVFVFFFVLFMPVVAIAQDAPDDGLRSSASVDSYGAMINNIISPNNTRSLSSLLIGIFALIGLINIALGLRKLVDWSDGKNGTTVSAGIYRILGGGVLIAFPLAVASLVGTVFGGENVSSVGTGTIAGVEEADTLSVMYTNFVKNAADPLTKASLIFGILLGLYLMGVGIMRLIESSNPSSPHANKTGPHLIKIIAGTVLINLQSFILISSNTVFSSSNTGPLQNAALATTSILSRQTSGGSGSGALEAYCDTSSYLYIGLIPFGVIAFIIGLRSVYMSMEGGQQASMAGGWVKIVAGIILVNMELFVNATVNTFSPSASFIQNACGG